jgi:hypothetical protein
LWLSCAEFVYTFFAFSDEIRVAYQRGRNRLRTREGTTAAGFFENILAKLGTKPKVAVAKVGIDPNDPPLTRSSGWLIFASSFIFDLVREVVSRRRMT